MFYIYIPIGTIYIKHVCDILKKPSSYPFVIFSFFCLPDSVFRFPGAAKVCGPLHAVDIRLPDSGPSAQTSRSRGALQVRVRRPPGLAEHRIAGQ